VIPRKTANSNGVSHDSLDVKGVESASGSPLHVVTTQTVQSRLAQRYIHATTTDLKFIFRFFFTFIIPVLFRFFSFI